MDEAAEYSTNTVYDIVTKSAMLTDNFEGKIMIIQCNHHLVHYLFITQFMLFWKY